MSSTGVVRALSRPEGAATRAVQSENVWSQLAPAGLFQTDAGGGYVYVNDQWCAITGISRQHATGAGWVDALHEDDRERVTRHWDDAIKLQCDFATEYRLRQTGGEERWVTAQARPVRNWRDTVVSHVGFITDTTDLKRVAERREELMERIQAARMAAESASHAKDEFFGVVSHELRNPLNSIQLWLEVLRPRAGDHPHLVAHAGQELQRHVRARVAVPDRGARLQVVRGVTGGRVAAVHVQRDPAHARQQEGLAVGTDPVGVPVGQGRPDLAGEDLADQPGRVAGDFHRAATDAAPSGKSTQARRRNDSSNALMVSCTSAPWAKSPWLGRPPSRISAVKSLTRQE